MLAGAVRLQFAVLQELIGEGSQLVEQLPLPLDGFARLERHHLGSLGISGGYGGR